MSAPHFPISASSVRFIKLGPGGRWESECIKEKHILRFGYESGHEGQLEDMRHGRWDKIRTDWLPKDAELHDRKAKQKATVATNALRVFYEDDGSTLWVTFYLGSLYWCFLEPGKPIPMEGDLEQTSYRSVRGQWSNLDAHGLALRRETLPGSINAVSMFRATTVMTQRFLRRSGR